MNYLKVSKNVLSYMPFQKGNDYIEENICYNLYIRIGVLLFEVQKRVYGMCPSGGGLTVAISCHCFGFILFIYLFLVNHQHLIYC